MAVLALRTAMFLDTLEEVFANRRFNGLMVMGGGGCSAVAAGAGFPTLVKKSASKISQKLAPIAAMPIRTLICAPRTMRLLSE
jgi:hypothetical protein